MFKTLPAVRRLTACAWSSVHHGYNSRRTDLSNRFHFKQIKPFSSQEDSRDPKKHGKDSSSSSDASLDEQQEPKVTILGKGSEKIGIMTLDEAQHLAKIKNLKLVKLDQQDYSRRDIYRMLTEAQLQQERVKTPKKTHEEKASDKTIKGEKSIVINSKITSHDLGIKIKSVQKWLTQRFQIRVTINNDAANSAEHVFVELEKAVLEAGGRILQKRKGANTAIQFTIQLDNKKSPPKADTDS